MNISPAIKKINFFETVIEFFISIYRNVIFLPEKKAQFKEGKLNLVSNNGSLIKEKTNKSSSISAFLDELETTHQVVKSLIDKKSFPFILSRNLGIYVNNKTPDDGFYYEELEFFKSEGLPPEMVATFEIFNSEKRGSIPSLLWAQKTKYYDGAFYQKDWVLYKFGHTGIYNGKPFSTEYYVRVNIHTGEVKAAPKKGRFNDWYYPAVHRNNGLSVGEKDHKKSAIEIFCLLYNIHSRRSLGITITAERDNITFCTVVPEHAWKHYFKDRIHVIENGKKKRIFHWVAAHTRQTTNGLVNIASHTKGIREFKWHDFGIKISMAGKHGAGVNSFRLTPELKNNSGVIEMTDDIAQKIKDISI